MDKDYREYIQQSNNDDVNIRLQNLPKLAEGIKKGDILKPNRKEEYVNNHIHTFYSFSPYSPVKAVLEAYSAGLVTCGIVDHDTVSGVEEFKEAGKNYRYCYYYWYGMQSRFFENSLKRKKNQQPRSERPCLCIIARYSPYTN
jgi:hypothetical protein